jgi:hypothetical protein
MTAVNKIESNIVGLRYAEETSPGVLPVTPDWMPMEPNSMSDFGGNVTTVTRNFISSDRQRHKGTITGRDAAGKFSHDLVQTKLQDLLQGFMFADLRPKAEFSTVLTVDDSPKDYVAASGLDVFRAGDLVFATGFALAANNGLKSVASVSATNLTVNEATAVETVGASVDKLVQVGFQFATGDAHIDVLGDLPELHTTAKDMTQFGLVPGEYVWIGGDTAATTFATAADSGFARIRSIAANVMVFDKTQQAFTIDAGGSKTIRIFFGRVLKNETGTSIVTRTYSLERTLGAPDAAAPTEIQYETVDGAYCDELTINIPEKDKVTLDLGFVGMDVTMLAATAVAPTGNRPAAVAEDAFNTSSNVPRINVAVVSSTDEAPTPLFSFITDAKITIKNNVTPDTAIGVVGAFDASIGNFEVSGSLTAFLASVAAVTAVHDYSDITLDMHFTKDNSGISIDMPLIHLGDGRLTVEKDRPVKLPLSHDAVTGAWIDSDLNHTLLFSFYDYLPTVAVA